MLKTPAGRMWTSPGASARITYWAVCVPRPSVVIAIDTFSSRNSLRLYQ